MTRSRRRSALLGGLLMLAACTTTYEAFEPPPLDYGDRAPLRFALGEVIVRSAYQPAGEPPYVEHTFVLTPEAATRRLLEQRLAAVGEAGTLQATILDASVQREPLATEGGLAGMVTTEPEARLSGRIKVRVDRLDERGEVISSVATTVTRRTGVPEGASFPERERIGYELVTGMVDDLDAGLVANLRENLAEFIVP